MPVFISIVSKTKSDKDGETDSVGGGGGGGGGTGTETHSGSGSAQPFKSPSTSKGGRSDSLAYGLAGSASHSQVSPHTILVMRFQFICRFNSSGN